MMTRTVRLLSIVSAITIPFLGLVLLLALLFAQSAAASSGSLEYAPGRLIVRLQPDIQFLENELGQFTTSDAALNQVLAAQHVQGAERLFAPAALDPAGLADIYALQLALDADVLAAATALAGQPGILWAEPDYLAYPAGVLREPAAVPDDPFYPQQWGLAKVQAVAAWDVETGSTGVVIAIVDSGIDLSHPDLAGKLWFNPGEVAGNGQDDDNNGLVDDVNGWNFYAEDANIADDNGHGTQVAGVAAAATNNAQGVAGMCWGCTIMPIKAMQASGVANYSDIAQGVLYAAQKGAEVINLSLGGYSHSSTLQTAIQAAVNDYGALVVGGAGNDGVSTPFYPAAYPEVLAAAGTDAGDVKASFSDYGDWVDVSAPAVAITTTFMGGDYGSVQGTSYAAPLVSGLAGLLRSQQPAWSQALVAAQIVHTADPIDAQNPGYEGLLGSGRINAAAALTAAPHPLLSVDAMLVNGDPLGRPTPGESATLEIILQNDWLDAAGLTGELTTTDPYVTIITGTASYGDIPAGGSASGSPVYGIAVALGAGYSHPIALSLELSANDGTYSDTLAMQVTTRSAEEQVWGTIGSDTTWTNDKTYIVMGNVGVAPGVTLTIQAGTTIEFDGAYSLNVGGTMVADGTEGQPIRFRSHNGAAWGRIYFDDTGVNAITDLSGTYQAGNILRWVNIEGAVQGIGCNNATPYLSHVTTDGGGVSCTTGSTQFWLSDSALDGDVNVAAGPDAPEPNGRWRPRADMPTGRYQLGVVAASNGKIYAIGGWGESGFLAIVEEYDPATDTWTTRASMPAARLGLGVAAASNGKIYAIGGYNGSYLTTVEEYDPATDTWTTRASMPTARSFLGIAAASNGKIYAIGGYDDLSPLATVEEYDPATDTWMTRANMPTARYGLGVATASNGKIYAIGGTDFTSLFATVEEYDPATNTWTTRASMPTARGFLGVAAASNGKIYAIGGVVNGGMFIATVEEYDPATDTWATRASMPTARSDLGITAASSGRIYAIGGYGSALMVVEEFALPSEGALYHMLAVQVSGGNVSIPNWAEVLSSTVTNGGIYAGDGSLLQGNSIEGSPGWAIQVSGAVTITGNRLVGNAAGIQTTGGLVQGNLIANASGVGLEISGDTTVVSNTFTGNAGNTIVIQSGAPTIQGNNLEGNTGAYDIQNLTTNDIPADGNWWGTTDAFAISQRIYDFDDDYNLGEVLYAPAAAGPVQSAPAYVRSVTLTPESPVGIETVTFEVEFSRPMQPEGLPQISFQSPLHNTWTVYNTGNSGLPNNIVWTIAADPNSLLWFGTGGGGAAHFDGTSWTVYNTGNSGLPGDSVREVAVDPDGSYWFGTAAGAAHFDGTTWTVYHTGNSGLPSNLVYAVAVDPDGSHWFGTNGGGVAHFDGAVWTVYDASNSGLPDNGVFTIAVDPDGSHWFGTAAGAAHFDGTTWTVYHTGNSGLPDNGVNAITVDPDGSYWFGTAAGAAHFEGAGWTVYNIGYVTDIATDLDGSHWFGTDPNGAAHFDGTTWTVYHTGNSGLPGDIVYAIAVDPGGSHWFGTDSAGVGVRWNLPPYLVQNNPLWLDETHFQTAYDITALVPRGEYRITVAGAEGLDGIEIAPNSAFTFTVDYAGGVGDTTPPPMPSVLACGAASPDTLSAHWYASDPDSEITLYQYAVGTTAGGSDVINWTTTPESSFYRSGLSLTAGQTYYVAAKARNAGGLWSEAGLSAGVVAGSGTCPAAAFSADVLSGVAPLTIQFTDQSTGAPTGWLWDFGDGSTSIQQNPSHTYTQAGTYTVSLLVSGPTGSDWHEVVGYIVVLALPSDTYIYLPVITR